MTLVHVPPYLLALVTEDHHRIIATAVLGAFGWSVTWREPRPVACRCEKCSAARAYQTPAPRMVLRQRIHPDMQRAAEHLWVLGRRRLVEAMG